MIDSSSLSAETPEIPLIILIGELKNGSPVWGSTFDSRYNYTEGQYRALFMRIKRLFFNPNFIYDKVFNLEGVEDIVIIKSQLSDISLLFCVASTSADVIDPHMVKLAINVAQRAGRYSAKKFYSEIVDLWKRPEDMLPMDTVLSPKEALVQLELSDVEEMEKDDIAKLLNVLVKEKFENSDRTVYASTITMLDMIKEDDDPDINLDAAYLVAEKYLAEEVFYYAIKTYEAIIKQAIKFERLALEISSKLKIARILKIQDVENSQEILNTLSEIDDGSLEVVSPHEREEFYCLQGYAFNLMGDDMMATDLYTMAIWISEGETIPSMNIAEAHSFLGEVSSKNYEPDKASREFLTASTIAIQNNEFDQAKQYEHRAAQERFKWARHLASGAVIKRMEGDLKEAIFVSWQSLNKVIRGLIHSHRDRRTQSCYNIINEVLNINRAILSDQESEYTEHVLDEVEQHITVLQNDDMTLDQENELLKFLSTKISTMIPLPNLIVMLIAVDGRLITGGEIGAENWDEAAIQNDELFSGALSAIMAILSEVLLDENPLRILDVGQTLVMIEKSKYCIGALLVDRDLNIIRKALKDTVKFMDDRYPELANWDGYSIDFEDVKPKVDELFKEALEKVSQE